MVGLQVVRQILASDIIGWILAFLGGVLVFKTIDNMQTSIARHTVIREIEELINKLFSSKIARSNKGDGTESYEDIVVRAILHDETSWKVYSVPNRLFQNGQRYVKVRDTPTYKEFISTQALHEVLIIFRRIEKLYKEGILKPIDLADLWREILPFGTSGKLLFLISYFGEEDTECIKFVIFNTVIACKRYKMQCPIEYIKKYGDINDGVKNLYEKNTRYRIQEKIKLAMFKKIIT